VARVLAIGLGVLVGAALGLTLGIITARLLGDAQSGMAEAEYLLFALIGGYVAPVVGAIGGGVVGARLYRR
jgi:hypothetical protein